MKADFRPLLDYMILRGLRPWFYFLDIGCQDIDNKVPLIEYLDAGRYFGVDNGNDFLSEAGQKLKDLNLGHKSPVFMLLDGADFSSLGRQFDSVLAYDLFTRMSLNNIMEYMSGIEKIIYPRRHLFMSFFENSNPDNFSPILRPNAVTTYHNREPFHYSPLTFQHLFNKNRLWVESVDIPLDALGRKLMVFTREPIPLSDDPCYDKWLVKNLPRQKELFSMEKKARLFQQEPFISVIMPLFNVVNEQYLDRAIVSICHQVYCKWELVITFDDSISSSTLTIIEKRASKEPRIKVARRKSSGSVSVAFNESAGLVKGEFIVFFGHEDLMTMDAFYEAAKLLNRCPDAGIIYSDSDKIDHANKVSQPSFNPDWSPDSFLSHMYIHGLVLFRRSMFDKVGGFRSEHDAARDYDILLRMSEKTEKIFHMPKILYHRRILQERELSFDKSTDVVADALDRRGEGGYIHKDISRKKWTVRYKLSHFKPVSIIMPIKDQPAALDKCLSSIFNKSTYPDYEVVIIDNGSVEKDTTEIISKWISAKPGRLKCHLLGIAFNYSKLNNYAATKTKGEYLLFLNNDTEVISTEWIEMLVEQAQRPSVGMAGPLLLYRDATIQHAGAVCGINGCPQNRYKGAKFSSNGVFSWMELVGNVSAVTGACMICRRKVFEEVGGFDENLSILYNDTDICLKMLDKGYKNVYLPHVSLYHDGGLTRRQYPAETKEIFDKSRAYFQGKWNKFIENDPYYNPNLSRKSANWDMDLEGAIIK